MLAWEIARQFQSRYCMTPFEELLGQYLSCGLVHSTPSVFLLAREVHWDNGQKEIIEGRPNAWFVERAATTKRTPSAGRHGVDCPKDSPKGAADWEAVRQFLRVAPYYHQWALWCRVSKSGSHDIHAYRWHKLAHRVGL